MKIRILLVCWVIVFSSSVFGVENGAQLFDKHCVACHVKQGPPTNAPPIFGVINHVRHAYPDRAAFVERIVNWVGEPNEEDALMPGAIRRFGLMPKLGFSEHDVRLIAEYLYDGKTELPEWYKKHYEEEHGQKPEE